MPTIIETHLCCPNCRSNTMERHSGSAKCSSCMRFYPLQEGILDMTGGTADVITPFQRIMQSSAVVSIYEKIWRPLGYFMASSRSFSSEMASVLGLQKCRKGDRVLDLACGTGIFTRPLARQVDCEVIGLDLSLPMLRRGQRLARKEAAANITYMRGSAFRLPFLAGTFDRVNCCGALHLFDRPADALDEIARVLVPGGFFSAQTTIRPARSAGFAPLLERFIRFGFFEMAELEHLLSARHFEVLSSERHRISYTFLCRHF
jgi:ubiquinone/menaquinone biosynthesis C-methylase UbiE